MDTSIEILSQPLLGGGTRLSAKHSISREALYARLPFSKAAQDRLAHSDVTIFGLGAGGALLALQLARAGVGLLRLVDPSSIEIHNIIRHMASLDDVGHPKVRVAAEIALRHNPTVEIDTFACDVFAPASPIQGEDLVAGSDLVIAATDRVGVQLAINELAWRMNIPAVIGGCYESALGGEVLFTLPGEGTPCLACLRAGLKLPAPRGEFDYSSAAQAEDFQGEPGFAAAVDLVTNIEAQIALGILLRGTGSPLAELIHPNLNFLLVGGALGSGFYRFKRPFHIFWQPLAGPRPGCPVCQSAATGEQSLDDGIATVNGIDELGLEGTTISGAGGQGTAL